MIYQRCAKAEIAAHHLGFTAASGLARRSHRMALAAAALVLLAGAGCGRDHTNDGGSGLSPVHRVERNSALRESPSPSDFEAAFSRARATRLFKVEQRLRRSHPAWFDGLVEAISTRDPRIHVMARGEAYEILDEADVVLWGDLHSVPAVKAAFTSFVMDRGAPRLREGEVGIGLELAQRTQQGQLLEIERDLRAGKCGSLRRFLRRIEPWPTEEYMWLIQGCVQAGFRLVAIGDADLLEQGCADAIRQWIQGGGSHRKMYVLCGFGHLRGDPTKVQPLLAAAGLRATVVLSCALQVDEAVFSRLGADACRSWLALDGNELLRAPPPPEILSRAYCADYNDPVCQLVARVSARDWVRKLHLNLPEKVSVDLVFARQDFIVEVYRELNALDEDAAKLWLLKPSLEREKAAFPEFEVRVRSLLDSAAAERALGSCR